MAPALRAVMPTATNSPPHGIPPEFADKADTAELCRLGVCRGRDRQGCLGAEQCPRARDLSEESQANGKRGRQNRLTWTSHPMMVFQASGAVPIFTVLPFAMLRVSATVATLSEERRDRGASMAVRMHRNGEGSGRGSPGCHGLLRTAQGNRSKASAPARARWEQEGDLREWPRPHCPLPNPCRRLVRLVNEELDTLRLPTRRFVRPIKGCLAGRGRIWQAIQARGCLCCVLLSERTSSPATSSGDNLPPLNFGTGSPKPWQETDRGRGKGNQES